MDGAEEDAPADERAAAARMDAMKGRTLRAICEGQGGECDGDEGAYHRSSYNENVWRDTCIVQQICARVVTPYGRRKKL